MLIKNSRSLPLRMMDRKKVNSLDLLQKENVVLGLFKQRQSREFFERLA